MPSGSHNTAPTSISATTARPRMLWPELAKPNRATVIRVAPTAGPSQWRAPPSTLIRITLKGTAMPKVSPTVRKPT